MCDTLVVTPQASADGTTALALAWRDRNRRAGMPALP